MTARINVSLTRAQALEILLAIGYKQECCDPEGDGVGITAQSWATLQRGEEAIARAYYSKEDKRHPDSQYHADADRRAAR